MVPECKTSVTEHMGGQTPMDFDDGGRIQFGPQPNIAPKTQVSLDSRRPPLSNKGGEPTTPVTSVHPEGPDRLLEALQGTSIVEEHHTLMSAVIEKVQSAKSGLTKVCTSLLTGFEVSNVIVKEYHSVDSRP